MSVTNVNIELACEQKILSFLAYFGQARHSEIGDDHYTVRNESSILQHRVEITTSKYFARESRADRKVAAGKSISSDWLGLALLRKECRTVHDQYGWL